LNPAVAILVSQGVDRQRKKGLVEVGITIKRYKRLIRHKQKDAS